jgi:uncharacterized protein YijF (DUF1287 family)
VEQVKDFRGAELAIGDIVAWTCGKSRMHLGKIVDATYLDQVGTAKIPCPSCGRMLVILGFE